MEKPELNILIVDDSPDDALLIIRELGREFSTQAEVVDTAQAMRDALRRACWDVVISDYVMPQFNGLKALQLIQEAGIDLPFIMVSGKMGEDVAVESMKAGAHDYLTKNNLSRLIPAVTREIKEAEIRRERRVTEEALRSSQLMFRSLVDQSLVGIYILQESRFRYVNPKFAEIFDYLQQQLISSNCLLDLVHEKCTDAVRHRMENCYINRGTGTHFTFQGVRRDGRTIDVETHMTSMEFDGRPALIGTLLDISERLRAEEELRKLSQVVEQSPVSVVITDTRGNIEYVNPKFSTVTGYTPSEVIGQNPRVLKSGRMSPNEYQELWDRITVGDEWHGEFHNRKKNGELFWESASISAIKSTDGVISHFVAVKEDITERKTAIEQLRQAQKMEAIGQLAGGISHDFNNLLTVINGYSTLALRSLNKNDPLCVDLEHILHAGERAAEMTRQLLAFSRRQIIEPRVIDINHLVSTLEKMLRRLIGEHIALTTSLDASLWQVKADPGQVEQIIMNLVVNARDALEGGGSISIRTSNLELSESQARNLRDALPGSYVLLEVEDNGEGIPEEILTRIFEPFFTTKPQGKGTGLGLATVYGITRQSGGFIVVDSHIGKGSNFRVYLPRVVEKVAKSETNGDLRLPTGGQTILVVEDEIGVLDLVEITLRKRGFQLYCTSSPQEALELFAKHADEIDLLLTDVVMPYMNGIVLAEELQKRKPSLKVIFMSGHAADTINIQKILEKGVAFLPKPFMNDILVEKISKVVEGRAA